MKLTEKYAYTVYRRGSFSKAAKALFISQPSLSEMIKKLENELGFLVFDRSGHPLKLTPQGVLYMNYLEEAFENERVMFSRIRSMTEPSRRELVVGGGGFVSRTLLPLACREYFKNNRDVNVKLEFADQQPHGNVMELLENNRIDLAVKYSYDRKRMVGIPLMEERYFLAFTGECPGSDCLRPYAIGINDVIGGETFVPDKRLYDVEPEDIHILINDYYFSNPELKNYINKIPRAQCRVSNARHRGVYYDLMLMGIGCIFVTDMIAAIEYHRSKNVLFVPIDNKRTLNLVYKNSHSLSADAQEFINVLTELAKRPKAELLSLE